MKDIEVLEFKNKLESKREFFNSSTLLDSEWSCMLEKAKRMSSRDVVKKREYNSKINVLSLFSSLRMSAALSFALVAMILLSFIFSSTLYSGNQNNTRTQRHRRSVPVINVSNRYI